MNQIKSFISALLKVVVEYYEAVVCAMGVCMLVTYASYQTVNAETIWGQGLKMRIIGFVSNGLGIAKWTGHPWYVEAWRVLPLVGIIYVCLGLIRVLGETKNNQQTMDILARILRTFIMGYIIYTYLMQYVTNIKYGYVLGDRRLVCLLLTTLLVGVVELLKSKVLWKNIERLEQRKYGCFIISLIMVILLYAFVFLTSPTSYLTVDDGDMQAMLSGVLTGEPFGIHRWTNVFLTQFISFMYSHIPNVQWWYVYSQVLVAMGILLVHYSILSIGKKRHCRTYWCIGALALVDVCFFFYTIEKIAFTVVPGVWGTGLVAYVFYLDSLEEEKKKRIWLIPFGFLLVITHRISTAKALLCYIMMASLYLVIKSRMKNSKKIVTIIILFCSLFISIKGMAYMDSVIKNRVYGTEDRMFEGWRGRYTDFSHASYDDNPEVYEQAGWTRETYDLVKQWTFWAEEVNADSLKYIIENDGVESLLTEDIHELALDKKDFRAVCIAGAFIITILAWAVFRTKDTLEKIFTVFNIVGTIILICYQVYIGRILYRSIVIVLMPAIVVNIILLQNTRGRDGSVGERKLLLQKICVICGAMLILLPTLEANYDADFRQFVEKYEAKEKALNEYVISNKDAVFICRARFIRRISPHTLYPNDKPSNLISWEAMPDKNGSSRAWLKQNNLDELSLQLFEHDNVNFLYSKNLSKGKEVGEQEIFEALLTYLKKHYDVIGFVKVDSIEGVGNVYHFIGKDEQQQYEKYMDISENCVVEIHQ